MIEVYNVDLSLGLQLWSYQEYVKNHTFKWPLIGLDSTIFASKSSYRTQFWNHWKARSEKDVILLPSVVSKAFWCFESA